MSTRRPPRRGRATTSRRSPTLQRDDESVVGDAATGSPLDALNRPAESGLPAHPTPRGVRQAAPAARRKQTLKAPTAVGKPPISPGAPAPDAGVGLPLPHERDESIGGVAPQIDPRIDQARRDIEAGQVDTDMRATPGLDAERRKELLRRGRR